MRPVAIDHTFPHAWEARLLREYLPMPGQQLYQFPGEIEEHERDGIYLQVKPMAGAAWTGFFARGFDAPNAVTGIFSCPDPDWLCALCGGYAFMVNAADPTRWEQVPQRPALDVRIAPADGLLLFAGFSSITAYGAQGHAWTTGQLSWEGLHIDQVGAGVLTGRGWDPVADKEVPFEVDLRTGKHTGGAAPRK